MCAKTRRDARYEVLGRVEADELSTFPGTLLDLSTHGCKIHYSNPVTVSLENEYTIKITFTEKSLPEPITLICQPMWASEDSGSTDIGMKFLHSPDTDILKNYIKVLYKDSQNPEDISNQIVENECQFI
ncbi:PilZ domain-containing protein [Treponema sp.]|uniref:PilZ domain-containing protein n=1 Tax=Treponema sp. TaxID=166 RepID=UPI00298D766A|nr:PilZ domain-containing protein [Treponema sp.]MCR5613972.1 PilZ domain-containing protein [Treponema sp.]